MRGEIRPKIGNFRYSSDIRVVLNQMFGLHSLHGLHGLHDNERIGISLSCICDLPCFRSLFPTQFKI